MATHRPRLRRSHRLITAADMKRRGDAQSATATTRSNHLSAATAACRNAHDRIFREWAGAHMRDRQSFTLDLFMATKDRLR